jgi:hypothetical protein
VAYGEADLLLGLEPAVEGVPAVAAISVVAEADDPRGGVVALERVELEVVRAARAVSGVSMKILNRSLFRRNASSD